MAAFAPPPASSGGAGAPGTRSWLRLEHPDVKKLGERWRYTRDHYTGEVLEPTNLPAYLIKKVIGEHADTFVERQRVADYTNHLATIVDGLAGLLWASDDKTTRTYGSDEAGWPLGKPDDPASVISRLLRDADGEGNGLLALARMATTELLLCNRVWAVVDGQGGDRVRVRLVIAEDVPNYLEDDGTLVEALLAERVDMRGALSEEAPDTVQAVRFTRTEWERLRETKDGGVERVTTPKSTGTGLYTYVAPDGEPALPIFIVKLGLSRPVGWLLAKKTNAIFNRESDRDNLLRNANHPKLALSADDTLFERLIERLREGSNAVQQDPAGSPHSYLSPPSEPATIAGAVIEEKVKALYETGFRAYGEAARERTATEVRQDVAHGVGAFLTMLATALDAFENGILWRVAQTVNVTLAAGGSAAFAMRVERSTDFSSTDPEAATDKLRDRVFGKDAIVPLGREGQVKAAREIGKFYGLEGSEEEIEAAVDVANALKLADAAAVFPLPASVRVAFLEKFLVAAGFVAKDDPGEKMADGSTKPRLEAIRAEALALAEAEDTAKKRGAEVVPGGFAGAGF